MPNRCSGHNWHLAREISVMKIDNVAYRLASFRSFVDIELWWDVFVLRCGGFFFIDITNLLASIELFATSSVLRCGSLCTSKTRLVLSRVKSTAIRRKRGKNSIWSFPQVFWKSTLRNLTPQTLCSFNNILVWCPQTPPHPPLLSPIFQRFKTFAPWLLVSWSCDFLLRNLRAP